LEWQPGEGIASEALRIETLPGAWRRPAARTHILDSTSLRLHRTWAGS